MENIAKNNILYEPPHEKTNNLRKQRRRLAKLTAKLISSFVFNTRIVQFLLYVTPKFQAFSLLLCLYSPVCVRPVQKPHCWFSHEVAHMYVKHKVHFSTVCSPSSRNCIFQNHTFLKDLKKIITMSPFCTPKVLKKAINFFKIGWQMKFLCQELILNRVFSIVKISDSREVTFFQEKNLNWLFFILNAPN